MAILNFPHVGLTIGQKYPASPVAGVPTYTWDGEKWTTQADAIGDVYVKKAGDTMSGNLNITKPAIENIYNTDAAGANAYVWLGARRGGKDRWGLHFVDESDETGLNAGGNFALYRFDDAGAIIDAPLTIQRQTGVVSISGSAVPSVGAMSYSGLQINGNMDVSQEIAHGTSVTATGDTICDGWKQWFQGPVVLYARTQPASWPGYGKEIAQFITTPMPTLSSNELVQVYTAIEGYRTAKLAWGTSVAQPITVSFWSNHFRPGLYSVIAQNESGERSYAAMYTHTTSNSSQYNNVTIPGCTDGVWNTGNGAGLYIVFTIASGPTVTLPSANTWHGVAGVGLGGGPGQVNAAAAVTDVFRLYGVTIHPGLLAPSNLQAAQILRPYGEELAICQRYWQQLGGSTFQDLFISGYGPTSMALTGMWPLSPTMRASPTLGISPGATFEFANGTGFVWATSSRMVTAYFLIATGVNVAYWYNHNATSYITLDARL